MKIPEIKNLKNRKIIQQIKKFLPDKEIIVLHGARQVGKTSILSLLANQFLKSKAEENNLVYFDLEDFTLAELCNKGVEEVVRYLKNQNCNFKKKIYLFIDEIQYLDNPSSFLKLFHDRYQNKIKLIITGSSSFAIKSKFKDSLVGRIINFEIFPLDFEEFLWFKQEKINLSADLAEITQNQLKILYQEYILNGGYPAIVLEPAKDKKEMRLKQIINTYLKKDIKDLAEIRNIRKFNDLLRILAVQSGNLVNLLELSSSLGIAVQTIEDYLFMLENTYIIKRIYPWHKNVRSELTKMPKIYFEDSGLANLLANQGFSKVIAGNLLENAVYSDLRKNFEAENIHFWRTNQGQEIDFILQKKNKLLAYEVKVKARDKDRLVLNKFKKYYPGASIYLVGLDFDDK
ncbi:MAG: ATP-binding protein, partial [Patescibacteria group bacterium]